MHKFPNFFSSDKKAAGGGGGGSGSGSGRIDSNLKQKKPRPRLERRNAKRIIDYELPSTSSTSSLSSDDYFFSRNSALDSPATQVSGHRSRSIDIQSFDKLTSFRIQGNCPGEFEIICKSLGLSGPDDFSIPAAEWRDMKVRSSSDVLPRLSRFNYDGGGGSGDDINLPIGNAELKDKTRRVGDVISLKAENPDFGSSPDSTPSPRVNDVINGNIEGSVIQALETDATPASCSNECLNSDKVGFGSRPDGRRGCGSNNLGYNFEAGFAKNERGADLVSKEHFGIQEVGSSIIKGARPPPLAPPPAMSLPPIDCVSSTWDLLKSFAPDNNEGSSRFEVSEDEDNRKRGEDKGEDEDEDEEVVRYVVESGRAGGENGLLSESCSFTTSNDDDSSSSTTEPLSNNSPNARFNSPNARFNSPNTRFNSPNGTFKRIITYWEKGELLGRGSFGSVYEGIADGGFFFAVKEVSLLDQGEGAQQSIYQLEQEIALLSQFEHENIVQYYGTDKDDSKLYIFLELVTKGSLLSLYQKYHLQDSMVSSYTRQILHGLKYLHDRNVVHRDIKCANMLVDANGYVKLADFGLAKATKLNDVKSFKGTALWMAPEVVNGRNKGYGLAADIWSLGCTVLEMLTRQFPYSHLETQFQALYSIGRGEAPRVPESLSPHARDFILQCLQVNPNSRPAASQLLNHPFVQRSPSFSSPASPYHPSRRL